MSTWEYTYVASGTGVKDELIAKLNELGALGWELVNLAAVDRSLGVNSLVAVLKRQALGLPAPEGDPAGWLADPSGRFVRRYWDGLRWTEHVADAAGGQSTDSPVPAG